MLRTLVNQSPEGEVILEIWNDANGRKLTAYFEPNAVEVLAVDRHGSTASQVITAPGDWLFYWDFLLK